MCKFWSTFVGWSERFRTFNCDYFKPIAEHILPPASPLSRICPRRRGGSPSGDPSAPPALSLRGLGLETLNGPPLARRMREGNFPPLAIPVGDEGEFTVVVMVSSKRFVPNSVRPSDVARGLVWDPLTLTLVWDRSSIPSRYLIDWGVCPKTYLNFEERPLRAIFLQHSSAHSRPIVNFIRRERIKFSRLNSTSLTQTYRNSARA